MFPISIRFRKKLAFVAGDSGAIMLFIKNFMANEGADEITISDNRLRFESPFRLRFSPEPLSFADSGEFLLEINDGNPVLIYRFYIYRVLIPLFFSSLFLGIFSKEWAVGLGFFTVVGCFLWGSAIFHNLGMFYEIHRKITNLLERKRLNERSEDAEEN